VSGNFELVAIDPPGSVLPRVLLIATAIAMVLFAARAVIDARRSDHGVWRSNVLIFLPLMPLSFNAVLVWIFLAKVARGMSLTGGSRGALCAGLAEALFPLFASSAASAAMAAFLLILCANQAIHDSGRSQFRGSFAYPALALSLSLAIAALWFSHRLFHLAAFDARLLRDAQIGFVVAALVALITIALAIRARRMRFEVPPWRAHAIALTALLVICTTLAIVAWRSMEFYRAVAMRGINPLS
jgi:hypothetical protein